MMSGPWLAANAPTKLATQSPDEFVVLHAGGEEEVAQKISVGALGEKGDVVRANLRSHLFGNRVALENFLPVGLELGGERRALQVEEQLRQRVVPHHPQRKVF